MLCLIIIIVYKILKIPKSKKSQIPKISKNLKCRFCTTKINSLLPQNPASQTPFCVKAPMRNKEVLGNA